jgi:hypothetical protein
MSGMPIRMTTSPEHVSGSRAISGKRQRDHATCTWEGREYQVLTLSATTALARELVTAGCPNQPWEAYTPNGTRSLCGQSLHAWAGKVVGEGDRGFRIRPFEERPDAAAGDEA